MKRHLVRLIITAAIVQAAMALIFVSPSSRGIQLIGISIGEIAVALLLSAIFNEYDRYKALRAEATTPAEGRRYALRIYDAECDALIDNPFGADGILTIAFESTSTGDLRVESLHTPGVNPDLARRVNDLIMHYDAPCA